MWNRSYLIILNCRMCACACNNQRVINLTWCFYINVMFFYNVAKNKKIFLTIFLKLCIHLYTNSTYANRVPRSLGTSVWILSPRKLDNSDAGFTKWKFMSVATWGEDPRGTWILDILDEVRLWKYLITDSAIIDLCQHVAREF